MIIPLTFFFVLTLTAIGSNLIVGPSWIYLQRSILCKACTEGKLNLAGSWFIFKQVWTPLGVSRAKRTVLLPPQFNILPFFEPAYDIYLESRLGRLELAWSFSSGAMTQPTRKKKERKSSWSQARIDILSDLRSVFESKIAIGLLSWGMAFTTALSNEEIILRNVFLCLACNPPYYTSS